MCSISDFRKDNFTEIIGVCRAGMKIQVLSLRLDPDNVLDQMDEILTIIRPTWDPENLVKKVT